MPLLPPYDYAMSVITSDEGSGGGGGADLYRPKWRFFPANPTLDSATQTPRNSKVGCWFRRPGGCTLPTGELRNAQAFGPWDTTVGHRALDLHHLRATTPRPARRG